MFNRSGSLAQTIINLRSGILTLILIELSSRTKNFYKNKNVLKVILHKFSALRLYNLLFLQNKTLMCGFCERFVIRLICLGMFDPMF